MKVGMGEYRAVGHWEVQDVKLGGQQDLRGCRGTGLYLSCCEEPARPFISMGTVGSGVGVKVSLVTEGTGLDPVAGAQQRKSPAMENREL